MIDPRRDVPAPGGEGGIGAEDIDLLERVRNAAAVLLAELPRSPERLRIRVRHVVLELDWTASTSTSASTSGAASTSAAGAPDRVPVTRPGPESHPAGPAPEAAVPAPAAPRITAPTVGTFYRSPEPGADPFVQVGDRVKPGQQVAIVEAMKLMLPVEADADGVIADVLADDGQAVEYGQALFALAPET